ncbi:MAG: ATP-dependent RecD-like DNA helicase [Chloroflexota bacterium]
MGEIIEGSVERVVFHSDETGFTVIRVRPDESADIPGENLDSTGLFTVVGQLPAIKPGELLRFDGVWTRHKTFGKQLRITSYQPVSPKTLEGIERFLGSGLIHGIGSTMASRIVKLFGADTLKIIDEEPERLAEVDGIGKKRAKSITSAWSETKNLREVMLFLNTYGVTTGMALRVHRTYGEDAIHVVRTDPYRLVPDIWGIGFKTADKMAVRLGFAPDSMQRVSAGVLHVLDEGTGQGHTFLPLADVISRTEKLLGVETRLIESCINELESKREIVVDKDSEGDPVVYLPVYLAAEEKLAKHLRRVVDEPGSRMRDTLDDLRGDWVKGNAQLSDLQKRAVETALKCKVSILTGGPGTGKTTALRGLIDVMGQHDCTVALASPTGRAAKRLSEATGEDASTIHRLLAFSPVDGFRHNSAQLLDVDMVVIDEVSMLDLQLAMHLLDAVDSKSHLLLVGDADQLPSVGAGNVLGDLVRSSVIPVTRLDTVYRQSADSHIISNAHRINQGEMPVSPKSSRDFFFFIEPDPQRLASLIVDIVSHRIPRRFGLDPMRDVQVMSPMHRGDVGVSALNTNLQEALNPSREASAERASGNRVFRIGDRVMQIRNNYQKGVFNGDIGRLVNLDGIEQTAVVDFDGNPVSYDWNEMDELIHAYAISVHKSQGSEYRAVVIPVATQHYVMLQRNLLYTAITRARELVVLVGTKKALAMAVRNDKPAIRYSGLAHRLTNTSTN